jgi:hypothetical protein
MLWYISGRETRNKERAACQPTPKVSKEKKLGRQRREDRKKRTDTKTRKRK